MDVQSGQPNEKLVVFLKLNMSNIFCRPMRLEAYLVGQINRSDQPNMSISTNLSGTGRWLQYNGKINNIGRPTLQICCTNQIFVQSSTSRPFYASRRHDSSACGIPASVIREAVIISNLG